MRRSRRSRSPRSRRRFRAAAATTPAHRRSPRGRTATPARRAPPKTPSKTQLRSEIHDLEGRLELLDRAQRDPASVERLKRRLDAIRPALAERVDEHERKRARMREVLEAANAQMRAYRTELARAPPPERRAAAATTDRTGETSCLKLREQYRTLQRTVESLERHLVELRGLAQDRETERDVCEQARGECQRERRRAEERRRACEQDRDQLERARREPRPTTATPRSKRRSAAGALLRRLRAGRRRSEATRRSPERYVAIS